MAKLESRGKLKHWDYIIKIKIEDLQHLLFKSGLKSLKRGISTLIYPLPECLPESRGKSSLLDKHKVSRYT